MNRRKRVLYVEGGGDHNSALAAECRKAFSKLFEAAGVSMRPSVVACGGRQRAYERFCRALDLDEDDVWLLVDAEEVIAPGPPFDPWAHVKARVGDHWARPPGATDAHLQFMAVCMETWLLCDHAALLAVFGAKLDVAKLPPEAASLEGRRKAMVYEDLNRATKPTPSGSYGKGAHSFKVLSHVAPTKLRRLSWAERFLDEISA